MSSASAIAPTDAAPTSVAGKYLTVILDHEAYGLPVLLVREIIRIPKITPVPQLPDYVKGVINLRGRVIPIMDLRLRFGLQAGFTDRTCIVVVQVKSGGDLVQMGLVVDSVEEVVILADDAIQPTPDFGVKLDTDYILGMAKIKDLVTTLLDITRVVVAATSERGTHRVA